MRRSRTLSWCVVREVVAYGALGLAAIGVVLVGRNLLRTLDELAGAGLTASDALALLGCLLALLAAYALPFAFLFGALVALSRMAADGEVTALRACGQGWTPLLVPVLLLGAAVAGATAWLVIDVEPRAHHELRMLAKSLAIRGLLVRPGEFREIDGRVVYARERADDHGLRGVLVADRSDPERPFLVFAESGNVTLDAETGAVHLRLARGDIHPEAGGPGRAAGPEARGRGDRIAFERFDYAFAATGLLGTHFRSLRPREMSIAQLRAVVARAEAGDRLDDLRRQEPAYYRMHLHRRLALPLAPVCFAIVAVPLGVGRARGGRARGALLCILVATGYYALLTLGQELAEAERLPAAALWLPNLLVAGAGALLLRRARCAGA